MTTCVIQKDVKCFKKKKKKQHQRDKPAKVPVWFATFFALEKPLVFVDIYSYTLHRIEIEIPDRPHALFGL